MKNGEKRAKLRLRREFEELAAVRGGQGILKLQKDLLAGRYRPAPVTGVEIPKASGGKRRLGIPAPRDQVVQQALRQVLEPLLDPAFSTNSFGYRPRRSAHDAVRAISRYVQQGLPVALEVDIHKFFDEVDHPTLIDMLAALPCGRDVLVLVDRFLKAGMHFHKVLEPREAGTPQGSPLSPLLANRYLDPLDRYLEQHGLPFARYADDVRILTRSLKEAEALRLDLKTFLKDKLRLQLSMEKTTPRRITDSTFLGYGFLPDGTPCISKVSLHKTEEEILRRATCNDFPNLASRIKGVQRYVDGRFNYFRLARIPAHELERLDRLIIDALYTKHRIAIRKKLRVHDALSEGTREQLRALGIRGFHDHAHGSDRERFLLGNIGATQPARGAA